MERFGQHIAGKLYNLGRQAMAIDSSEACADTVLPYAANAQIGGSASREFLSSLGIHNFDACVAAIGDSFQGSLKAADLPKELRTKKAAALASRGIQEKFLLRNGADEAAYPEKQPAARTSIRCTSEHVLSYIELDAGRSVLEPSTLENWR